MDRDHLIISVLIIVFIIINAVISYFVGLDLFPIINPEFCYESFNITFCNISWSVIEISGMVILLYFLFYKKSMERIH